LKWLELLNQIAPHVARAAILYDPEQPTSPGYLKTVEATAPSFRVQILPHPVRDAEGIGRAIETLAADPKGGLILPPGALMVGHRDLIISLAARHRLPSIFAFRYYVAGGGLASYGVDTLDLYRRAAGYVDRVLKGETPANLPVEFADKFWLSTSRPRRRLAWTCRSRCSRAPTRSLNDARVYSRNDLMPIWLLEELDGVDPINGPHRAATAISET